MMNAKGLWTSRHRSDLLPIESLETPSDHRYPDDAYDNVEILVL